MPKKVFYPHRYKDGKVETKITDSDFRDILLRAREYREERRRKYGDKPRFKDINVAALLSLLYYLGLRVAEVVGDTSRRYQTKTEGEKFSEPVRGILREDISVEQSCLRILCLDPLKHGKREDPLWIPLNKRGAKDIYNVVMNTLEGERIFPVCKTTAWRFVRETTGKFYPHFFRLNRASVFASHPDTTIMDMKKWFGWVDPRTIDKYLAKGGRETRKMADRL